MAGGSHLPDITVITPVFSNDEIVFFVASRGHHADIGGMTPGSMPPQSKSLNDEGAHIISFKLVKGSPDGTVTFQVLASPPVLQGGTVLVFRKKESEHY